jgi:formimidoylglutamate deiminase
MYAVAESMTPERLREVAAVAFAELAEAGVRTVGEFHYLHHQRDGAPYAQRTLLADIVIEAALDAGLRIALLRVAYQRADAHGSALFPAQKRFVDGDVDEVLRDVETLRSRWHHEPRVRIGIAPHSVRAVGRAWLRPLAQHAARHQLPLHMHVAEQPAEIDACLAETNRRPVELLADHDVLGDRFVAVHATHLLAHEAELLGQARAFACICPTTERDLGDGLPNLSVLRAHGVRLCVGIDSHVVCDPLEEIRALETGERLRTLQRNTIVPRAFESPAAQLWHEGSRQGTLACGFADDDGHVEIATDDRAFSWVADEFLLDALVFGAPLRVIRRAW